MPDFFPYTDVSLLNKALSVCIQVVRDRDLYAPVYSNFIVTKVSLPW